MKLYRETLTPQMLVYDDFNDRAETRWLPYLMYFHRTNYSSDVINTDRLGFRISHGANEVGSVGGAMPPGPVRLLAGASSALGMGATSDRTTLSSLLWSRYSPRLPWLNFGAQSYNSLQELMLYVINRHLLNEVDEIVILGGFNSLALAQLPDSLQADVGAFFFCGDFLEQMDKLKDRLRQEKAGLWRSADKGADKNPAPSENPALDPQLIISRAVTLTARYLEMWQQLAGPGGTRISYVFQPLAPWWREEPAPPEKELFTELDRISKYGTFEKLYGKIATMEVAALYAKAMEDLCAKLGVVFLNLNPLMAEVCKPEDWLYVDRCHYTDAGHHVVARLIAEQLSLA